MVLEIVLENLMFLCLGVAVLILIVWVIKKESIEKLDSKSEKNFDYVQLTKSFFARYEQYTIETLEEEIFNTECEIKENDLEISSTTSSIQNRINMAMLFFTIIPFAFTCVWYSSFILELGKWIIYVITIAIAVFCILYTTLRCKRILYNNIVEARKLKLKLEILNQIIKEKSKTY